MIAYLTPYTCTHMHAHVLLADVISVRSLLHEQEVTVVYADQQLGDYPLRLSHLYSYTSGERKYMHMLSLSIFPPLLSDTHPMPNVICTCSLQYRDELDDDSVKHYL